MKTIIYICSKMCERERQRERERETHTQREKQIEKQNERKTERKRHKNISMKTIVHLNSKMYKEFLFWKIKIFRKQIRYLTFE
jgi:hypothetical protein